jgi:hypothetical protein
MSEIGLFVLVFGGLFVLRFVLLTFVFFCILPSGDRCPQCDDHTLWVRAPIRNRIFPWLRTSWCPTCGWEGSLRHDRTATRPDPGAATAEPQPERRSW